MPGGQRTAFVTGATGFLGLNLVEQLVAAGWRVTALHRPTSDVERLARFPVALAEGDVVDAASLRRSLPGGVDAAFHLAADTSVWSRRNERQTRVNVEGTRNVLAAARAAGARRLLHTSSWGVFAPELQEEIHEDSPMLATESWINYTRTKYLAERAVREAVEEGLDAVIVHPTHVVGRYDDHGWATLIRLALGRRIPGVPPGSGSFCHAEEVARTMIAAVERAPAGRGYLLGGTDATFAEFVRTVGEVSGRKVPTKELPAWIFRITGRLGALGGALTGREPRMTPEGVAFACARARVVSTRAQDELGYRPVPLATMIRDSYDWLAAEGLV